MVQVRQRFTEAEPVDIEGSLANEFERTGLLKEVRRDARVAVAVGSRGIDRLGQIIRETVKRLQAAGMRPFLVPAMGSHGGATPEGQLQLMADYGVTEAKMGVPIDARMEAEVLGDTEDGVQVFMSQAAVQADGILLVNRVKPHTDFGGAIGSGLMKMLVVGLGKHAGALGFHRAAQRMGHERALRTMAATARQCSSDRLIGGLAIIEDARHHTARLELVPGQDLEQAEPRLAAEAAKHMPRLPLEEIDLLIIDVIGKNISGTGMDPNVTGRMIHGYSLIETELPKHPRIRRILVRDLSPESHGNATGIGMADFTTERLVHAMDREVTYMNALTALSLQGSKVPIVFPNDQQAVAAALATLGLEDARQARVIRIVDTLSLADLQVSQACLEELRGQPHLEIVGETREWAFDSRGDLVG
jgi:hypothetical protein